MSVLVRAVDKVFMSAKVSFSINNITIDFDFMESFIAKLEAERTAKLSAYLKLVGLDNYELSAKE